MGLRHAFVVELLSERETGADELDHQLTVEENHGCSSRHGTLLQNELVIINQQIDRNMVVVRKHNGNVAGGWW